MDIRQQLLLAFEAEHREHLDAIRSALAAQANGGTADWNDVFRRAHSLKGAARAVDFPPVEALAHRLETLFERVSSGRTPLERDARAAVSLALDRIEAYVADFKTGASAPIDDALAALDACQTGEPDPPPEPVVRPEPQPEVRSEPEPVGAPPEPAQSLLRVPAIGVQAVTDAAHNLASVIAGIASLAGDIARIEARTDDLAQRARDTRALVAGTEVGRLRSGLGEIETGLAGLRRLTADLSRAQVAAVAALDRAGARVRDEAERLALVPAESAFGGYARTLRETARAAGQEIEITVRGLDVPMDRATLQVLKDPVLHALRNALSHGAQSPEDRLRLGKPAALQVRFAIVLRGGRLVIAVHDDGPGPDLAAIERRARERGLLRAGEPANPERLLELVFEPGFSTAASVDTLSGRGIGLAVVGEAARRLGGDARLAPRVPDGAALTIRVPLGAARRALLVVEAGGATYAVPSSAIERLLRLRRSDLGTAAGRPVVHLRQGKGTDALPFAELAPLLGGPASVEPDAFPAILIRADERRCALRVDALAQVRTALVQPAPPIGADAATIAGTVILDNENPALVLDADGLLDRVDRGERNATPRPVAPRADDPGTMRETRRSTILVVDDSITTRTLEKSILEAAGYRVVVCVDGQDALDHLRSGSEPVDLVVADVEMPRLDGFGLVKALRAENAFGTLPIILMTSRGAPEDVARGLELGADAYLTKQAFDQRELLDTVGQLL